MGVRVDLVDKEVYQINPNIQKAANGKVGEEDKVLEDLKAKLLTGRDKFLLSEKDTVPTFNLRKKSVDDNKEHLISTLEQEFVE